MKKRNKIFLIIGIVILVILIAFLIKLFAFPHVIFKLNGNKNNQINYGDDYNDLGFVATVNGLDYTDKIKITGEIDLDKVGTHEINYILELLNGNKITLTRTVEIVDTIKPDIKLVGDNPLKLNYASEYKDPGYEVSDNYYDNSQLTVEVTYDKDIDTKKADTYKVTYKVTDGSGNYNEITREVIVNPQPVTTSGLTYIQGILIVNKKYSLPANYNPGVNQTANEQLKKMQAAASALGYSLSLCSGFRSYSTQQRIYNNYVAIYGQAATDTFSARPGHSEHQSGLAFDIGAIDDNFGNTPSGKWLNDNAHNYGFIIRYPEGKQHITGYKYEPWHVRYLGVEIATKVYNSGLSLEEYLGI